MQERLTQAQLAQVIAEIEQLSQRSEADLDKEQVKQILQELNLSSDLLDNALVQIRRREALAAITRRNRWIAAVVIVVVVGAIAATTVFIQHRQQVFSRVLSVSSRVTLAQEDGGNLTVIDINPRVYYHVTLNEAPVGEKLALTCDWIDPNGKIAYQSRYQTREIDRAVWSTYCYYQLSQSATAGRWKVQMSLEDRPLSSTFFTVK